MNKIVKRVGVFGLAGAMLMGLAGCPDDAAVVYENTSKAADNFEVPRRIVFINGITDSHLLVVEGFCSVMDDGRKLNTICKREGNKYVTNKVGLSDNVTYVVEQLEEIEVSPNHYRRTFKPQSIIPDIDFRGDAKDLITNTAK